MTSEVNVQCTLKFDRLNELLTEKLKGRQIADNLEIDAVELSADDELIYAALHVKGKRIHKVLSQFKLVTPHDSAEFVIEELKVHIDSTGLLAKGANFLVKHVLADKVEATVQQQVSQTLTILVRELTTRYASVDLGEGLKLQSFLEHYRFSDVSWDSEAIRCKLKAAGLLGIELS